VSIAQTNVLLRSTEHRWALATPDGLTKDVEPVETKNIAWGYDPDEWAQQIPEKYYIQCQQQMLVTGAPRCLFGALLWGSRLIWEWVPRDSTTIGKIISAGRTFWGHVERREPPMSDGHPNARKLLGNRANDNAGIELYDNDIGDYLHEYRTSDAELKKIRAAEKRAKRQRDAAADAIAQKMGAHRAGFTATGWSIKWQTVERRGFTVDPTSYEQLKISPPKEH